MRGIPSEGGKMMETATGRVWRSVVALVVLASLLGAGSGGWSVLDGDTSIVAGCPGVDADGGDGDPGLSPASTLVLAPHRPRARLLRSGRPPGAPWGALIARHLDDCGLDSCSGTALPPPASS